jgi:pimeloyl-ACP methyl ester carboxylesterase
MKTATSKDGTPIAYWVDGQGPPLVLVHGAVNDRTAWVLVQPALAQRFTVYAMHRRGREGSGPPKEHALEREFEDVVAVIEAIGEPVHLLGHSGGATCSLEAALLTDRIRSLTLYEPPYPDPAVQPVIDHVRGLARDGKPGEAVLAFFRTVVQVPEDQLERLVASPLWPNIAKLGETLPSELDAFAQYRFEASRFAALDLPMLLLVGGDSPLPLRYVSEDLVRTVPNARLVELAGQQHGANLTAPDLFVREVTAFLDGVQS